MARTPSIMLDLGTEEPPFSLPSTDGTIVSRDDFKGKKGLLVLFICNHCPFVKHVRDELARIGREYQAKDIGVVAIMSNDVENYPDDHPDKMREEKASAGYTFPYLYDETQEVAAAYRATCTPDIFLFDADFRLFYRGQLDDSRPGMDKPVTGADLRAALDALLDGRPAPDPQRPSLGCNIKWKGGEQPF